MKAILFYNDGMIEPSDLDCWDGPIVPVAGGDVRDAVLAVRGVTVEPADLPDYVLKALPDDAQRFVVSVAT